jgi:hypothetical protein
MSAADIAAANAQEASAKTGILAGVGSVIGFFFILIVVVLVLVNLRNGKAKRMNLDKYDVPLFWFIGSQNRSTYLNK